MTAYPPGEPPTYRIRVQGRLGPLGYVPPAEYEAQYYAGQAW